MAIQINWSFEAIKTFDNNINYLIENWSDKEVQKFVFQTEAIIKSIRVAPQLYRRFYGHKYIRKVVINKYKILYYRHYPKKEIITLLTFWNGKQHPSKLKY